MRQRPYGLVLLLALTLTTPIVAKRQVRRAGEESCDRACRRGLLTQYLDAMIAHAPGRLPLANAARFTEDPVDKPLGEDGSLPDRTRSFVVWEAFTVYGGRIHAVEAFMEQMPRGSSSGREGRGGTL